MFALLQSTENTSSSGELTKPPASWIPPPGHNWRAAWRDVLGTKHDIDFCVSEFHLLDTRVKCMRQIHKSPLLA
jgi:hypothetical protein